MTTGHEGHLEKGGGRTKRMLVISSATLLASLALAVPALALVIHEPPTEGREIISFPERDFVSVGGFDPEVPATVNILRNNVVIGTAHGTTSAPTPDPDPRKADPGGGLEVNHPGGVCWEGTTPDILPGDKVRVTIGDVADQTTTANVKAGQPFVDDNGTPTPADDVVVVKGTADDITQPGQQPLPIDQIEQRLINPDLVTGKNGRSLRAPGDGTLRYDAPGSVNWTARYPNAQADIASGAALASESRILWLGSQPLVGSELTIFEVGGSDPATPGPTPPCTAPLAQTAITSFDRSVVNIANVGTPMVVSGVAQAEATSVSVSVPGGVEHAGTLTTAPSGQQTWKATIPAAELGALPQGSFPVTASFAGPGVPASHSKSLRKDTVAPRVPIATPKAGTYTRAQSVSLEAQAGTKIRFTQNGTTPTLSSRLFVNQIRVTATQTIKAIAVDSANNKSAVASFRYVIR